MSGSGLSENELERQLKITNGTEITFGWRDKWTDTDCHSLSSFRSQKDGRFSALILPSWPSWRGISPPRDAADQGTPRQPCSLAQSPQHTRPCGWRSPSGRGRAPQTPAARDSKGISELQLFYLPRLLCPLRVKVKCVKMTIRGQGPHQGVTQGPGPCAALNNNTSWTQGYL